MKIITEKQIFLRYRDACSIIGYVVSRKVKEKSNETAPCLFWVESFLARKIVKNSWVRESYNYLEVFSQKKEEKRKEAILGKTPTHF